MVVLNLHCSIVPLNTHNNCLKISLGELTFTLCACVCVCTVHVCFAGFAFQISEWVFLVSKLHPCTKRLLSHNKHPQSYIKGYHCQFNLFFFLFFYYVF